MAADLEALYDHYRARGVDEEEAVRLTEERMLASPEALHHLVVLHTTGYQRWLGRASQGVRWGLEVILFILGVLPIVAFASLVVATRLGQQLADPLLWPILLVGAGVTGVAAWKAAQLVLGRARSTGELHRGLPALLFLAVTGPLIGGTVFLVNLYRLSLSMMAVHGSPDALLAVAEPLARNATLLAMGLLLGIGGGLVWFVLVNRIARLEQAESAALLAE
jgi:hypothetical protein